MASPTPLPGPIVWTTRDQPAECTVYTADNRVSYGEGGRLSGTFLQPQGTGPFPAALVLHTRGGLLDHEQDIAAWLASQGYVALAPDYFTPLGVTAQTFESATFGVQYSDEAREIIAQALECLKSLSFVDPNRIGAVGFSLGGYFGFMLATRDDVKGVVSYYGAYHGSPVTRVPTQYSFSDIVNQLRAPILMLHGDQDTTIPITRANRVENLLTQGAKAFQLIVYPGVEHRFDMVDTLDFNFAAAADAQAKTLDFLRENLE